MQADVETISGGSHCRCLHCCAARLKQAWCLALLVPSQRQAQQARRDLPLLFLELSAQSDTKYNLNLVVEMKSATKRFPLVPTKIDDIAEFAFEEPGRCSEDDRSSANRPHKLELVASLSEKDCRICMGRNAAISCFNWYPALARPSAWLACIWTSSISH